MQAIMMSIRPRWVAKILNYIKKDEIRKGTTIGKAINRLIKEQGVAPVLIYCTKDKNLMGKFGDGLYHEETNDSCWANGCSWNLPKHYLNGKVVAKFNATAEHIEYETCSRDISGWWKDNGEMYDHKDACLTYKEMFDYIGAGEGTVVHINNLEIFNEPKEISEFMIHNIKKQHVFNNFRLTRAPQSWCHVEVENE